VLSDAEHHKHADVANGAAASDRIFTARLAEWTALRDDVIGSISNQHLVLTFGTASIAAVLIAAFTSGNRGQSVGLFLAASILSLWVLAMWLAEVVRMLRAVAFCRIQESQINDLAGAADPPALFWEPWKEADPRRTLTWNYPWVVAMLSLSYGATVVLAIRKAHWPGAVTWSMCVLAALILGAAGYFVFVRLKYWIGESLGPAVSGWLLRPQFPWLRRGANTPG